MASLREVSFCAAVAIVTIHCTLSEYCSDRVCKYQFDVRRRRSMTYRHTDDVLYDVEAGESGLSIVPNLHRPISTLPDPRPTVDPDQVPIVDGIKRNIITVNNQYPGPTIEVKQGTKVIVNVCNHMFTEGLSIHWHGLYQRNTQRYDGVAFVTQCPVLPGTCFKYQFIGNPSGTHWYHGHHSNQRWEGLYGMVIIHRKEPKIPSHSLMIQDVPTTDAITHLINSPFREFSGSGEGWLFFTDRERSVDGRFYGWDPEPVAVINGRGRRDNKFIPLTKYSVKSGQWNRIRIVHAGADYGYEISIDDHQFYVVASDGYDMRPLLVTSLYLQTGETYDIEFRADQPVGRYWVRAETLNFDETGSNGKLGFAILEYEGASGSGDPTTQERECTSDIPCEVFNCHMKGFADSHNRICYDFNDARSRRSTRSLDSEFGIRDHDYDQRFIVVGNAAGVTLNNKLFKLPGSSLLQDDYKQHIHDCDELDCTTADTCRCTHFVDIPYGKTIQLVMTNRAGIFTPHPMHLHGHGFAVLKQGFADLNTTTGRSAGPNEDVDCGIKPNDPSNPRNTGLCLEPKWAEGQPIGLNNENPPIKDTITVPPMGYVVVRFKANNPGMWLFHCHIDSHFNDGMVLVFRAAEERIGPLPRGFPTCGDYDEDEEEGKRRYNVPDTRYDLGRSLSSRGHSRKDLPWFVHAQFH